MLRTSTVWSSPTSHGICRSFNSGHVRRQQCAPLLISQTERAIAHHDVRDPVTPGSKIRNTPRGVEGNGLIVVTARDPTAPAPAKVSRFRIKQVKRAKGINRPDTSRTQAKWILRPTAVQRKRPFNIWKVPHADRIRRAGHARLEPSSKPGFRLVTLSSHVRSSAVYSHDWNTSYTHIAKCFDPLNGKEIFNKDPGPPDVLLETPRWAEAVETQMQALDAPVDITTFAAAPGKTAREVWLQIAIRLLYHELDRMLDFLLATNISPYPPINWVEDSVRYLASHLHRNPETKPEAFSKLVDIFLKLVDRDTNEDWDMVSSFHRIVLPHCSYKQADALYKLALSQKVKTGYPGWHRLTIFFANNENLEQGISSLLEARRAGSAVNTLVFHSNITTLLRQAMHRPDGMRICLRLVENLVAIGVKLNMRLCNTLILNAIEAGDASTAWALYRSALDQGLRPYEVTYGILLKLCQLNIGDTQALSEVVEDAIAIGKAREHPWLAAQILYSLSIHHLQYNPDTAFRTVCDAYVELFDAAPLQRLGLPLTVPVRSSASGSKELLPPSKHAMFFVIMAYIKSDPPLGEVKRTYTAWRELVAAGDSELGELATHEHTSNMFLTYFIQSKHTLLQAAEIVKDMQRPLPASLGIIQAPPNVYTWSIFLDGFARSKQVKLAEQVLGYMRSKGMEPNTVTWSSLIRGYSKTQSLESVLDAVKRAEASGAVWDEYTEKAVARFANRQRLARELQRQRMEKALDFSRELKDSLEHRIMTPTPTSTPVQTGNVDEGRGDALSHYD